MNLPILRNDTLSMNSQEIAELVRSRHDSVKRTIERLSETGVIQYPPMVVIKNHQNRDMQVFIFSGDKGKRDSIIVVAQLSPEFTATMVDRWQYLESQAANNYQPSYMIDDPIKRAERWIEEEKQRQIAASEVIRLQEVCETITNQFKSGMPIVQFCRLLNGVNLNKVQAKLVDMGYLIKNEYGYRVRSPYRDKYFIEKRKNENGHSFEYVAVSHAGAKLLYKKYLRGGLPMKKDWDGKYSHDLFEENTAIVSVKHESY